jgi:hypothetical protein
MKAEEWKGFLLAVEFLFYKNVKQKRCSSVSF